ncbi:hypothetical protein BN2537_2559 [Streptomyces venezuelae]|nr:hypothetical protein BN2537_2559 [Streptomyces venezuelae]
MKLPVTGKVSRTPPLSAMLPAVVGVARRGQGVVDRAGVVRDTVDLCLGAGLPLDQQPVDRRRTPTAPAQKHDHQHDTDSPEDSEQRE